MCDDCGPYRLSYFEMVREFHEGAKIPVVDKPTVPPDDRYKLRAELHREEYKELETAMFSDDLIGVADGISDLIVVLCGTALEYGIPLDEVFSEVHRSNMTKLVNPVWREDGKLLKGEAYEPPDLRKVFRDAAGK